MTIPVVCIHGALRSKWGMLPTTMMLRRHGFDAVGFDYATRSRSLVEHGAQLAEFVARRFAGAEVVGAFTHSMGGLVVRAGLACAPEAFGRTQRIVMLSPPNQGSSLARRMQDSRWAKAMYGLALDELREPALPPLPSSARALILAGGTGGRGYNPRLEGDNDGVVAVAEMGLPGVEPTFIGGPHSTLQWSPKVLRSAVAFLRGE